jgi:hypothetical protein
MLAHQKRQRRRERRHADAAERGEPERSTLESHDHGNEHAKGDEQPGIPGKRQRGDQ